MQRHALTRYRVLTRAGEGEEAVTRVELKPGTHTLQLLLADHNHIPHHPVVASERITITVK